MPTPNFTVTAPQRHASVGLALRALGFSRTRWIPQDGQIGQFREGVFNPTTQNPVERYGNPRGLGAKGWPSEQYTGTHSTGFNQYAVRLAPIVLDAVADQLQDQTDLNFVVGATQHVLSQSYVLAKDDDRVAALLREFGMLGGENPAPKPPPPPPPPPPPTPAVTPVAERVKKLQEQLGHDLDAVMLDEWARFLATPSGALLLTRAVELYRKVMGK